MNTVIHRNAQWCVLGTGAMVSPSLNVSILPRDVAVMPSPGLSLYDLPMVAYEDACSPELFCDAWLRAVYLIEDNDDNDAACETVNNHFGECGRGFPNWLGNGSFELA